MKQNLMMVAALTCIACGEAQPEPIYLTKDYYDWTCKDYQEHSEIVVSTETCEDRESGLWYLIAETHLYTGTKFKRRLVQEEPCHYTTNFILIEEVCIEVDGVMLTAWVDQGTWSGALFGD